MTSIAISSGHGLHIRGARGNPVPPQLDERDENVRVVDQVYAYLKSAGIQVAKFHDDVSQSQGENLDRIVNWHNQQSRDLDVSIHFNAYDHTAHGAEVLYVSDKGKEVAQRIVGPLCAAGNFTNRGAKHNPNLAFLNGTDAVSVLVETCFCDHTGDSNNYRDRFEEICRAIAETIGGVQIPIDGGEGEQPPVDWPERPDPPEVAEQQPVRVTVEHPPGVTVNLSKTYNNAGIVDVVITHPRSQQVDTDVREVAAPSEGVPSNQRDIIATVFQDDSTAYDPFDGISDTELAVSLPANITDAAQRQRGVKVWNRDTGESEIGKIRDKGPWLVDDDAYVFGNARPLAETCAIEGTPLPRGPHAGKIPNGAGIDLSPGLARAVSIDGKGKVDWDFVQEETA